MSGTFGPFSAGNYSSSRVTTGLKLVSIDGIWSSQQNETNFCKIGPKLWSPGPKKRKNPNRKNLDFLSIFQHDFFAVKHE